MSKCSECDGTGEKFILPGGNPFHMKLPQLARSMVKVRCFHCKGTGDSTWAKSQYSDDEIYR